MKVITIGRGQDNDIVINDPLISRNHLQLIQKDDGTVSVVDLNSSNGTYVNGHKITGEHILSKNDTVLIGRTTLQWQKYVTTSRNSIKKKILISLSILIAAGAITTGIVLLCKDKKNEDISSTEYTENRDSLKKAADKEYQEILKQQRDALKRANKKEEEEAKKAEQQARQAEKAKNEALKEAEQQKAEAKEAKEKAIQSEKAKNEAIEKAETAEQDKYKAEGKAEAAEKAKLEAEKRAKEAEALTERTLDELYAVVFQKLQAKRNKLKTVAIQLGLADTASNYEQYIDSLYAEGDISKKREIINKIQKEIESKETDNNDK